MICLTAILMVVQGVLAQIEVSFTQTGDTLQRKNEAVIRPVKLQIFTGNVPEKDLKNYKVKVVAV